MELVALESEPLCLSQGAMPLTESQVPLQGGPWEARSGRVELQGAVELRQEAVLLCEPAPGRLGLLLSRSFRGVPAPAQVCASHE